MPTLTCDRVNWSYTSHVPIRNLLSVLFIVAVYQPQL